MKKMRVEKGRRRLDGGGSESESAEDVRAAMRRMNNGKALGPGTIPVEVWRCT